METEGWVPVHPERGPDWAAFTMDEDEADRFLVPGYEWKRCIVKVADEEPS